MGGWRDGMEGWREGGMAGWREGGMEGWREGGSRNDGQTAEGGVGGKDRGRRWQQVNKRNSRGAVERIPHSLTIT
eukprot:142327-Rhodomonas_salina.2